MPMLPISISISTRLRTTLRLLTLRPTCNLSTVTPAVLVDEASLQFNLHWMQSKAKTAGVALRPHIKTHKSLHIAEQQIKAGAIGVTASKASEASVFIEHGIEDVTVAYPLVDLAKVIPLLELMKHHRTRGKLVVDSLQGLRVIEEAVERTKKAVDILIEVDTGLHRCGIEETNYETGFRSMLSYLRTSGRNMRFAGKEREAAEKTIRDMLDRMAAYANAQLDATAEEYAVLAKLNVAAADKYKELADRAVGLVSFLNHLNQKYESMKSYLDQIDQLGPKIARLDQVVDRLEEYSKQLELQFQRHYS